MKTYPFNNNDGKLISFEIPNCNVSRNQATQIIASVAGVKITRFPKKMLSWFREDVFCEFELNGLKFDIEEPFGDNSRYLIAGEKNYNSCDEIVLIEKTFKEA